MSGRGRVPAERLMPELVLLGPWPPRAPGREAQPCGGQGSLPQQRQGAARGPLCSEAGTPGPRPRALAGPGPPGRLALGQGPALGTLGPSMTPAPRPRVPATCVLRLLTFVFPSPSHQLHHEGRQQTTNRLKTPTPVPAPEHLGQSQSPWGWWPPCLRTARARAELSAFPLVGSEASLGQSHPVRLGEVLWRGFPPSVGSGRFSSRRQDGSADAATPWKHPNARR